MRNGSPLGLDVQCPPVRRVPTRKPAKPPKPRAEAVPEPRCLFCDEPVVLNHQTTVENPYGCPNRRCRGYPVTHNSLGVRDAPIRPVMHREWAMWRLREARMVGPGLGPFCSSGQSTYTLLEKTTR
jgi:hypothetical protein